MFKPSRRMWLYLPWTVAAIILAGYFMLWRAGAAEMKKGVNLWIAEQREAGWTISHGEIKSEGFPFFLRVHIEKPDIAHGDNWRWRTNVLTLDALPYDLNKLIFSVRSGQQLRVDGLGEWRISAEDFRASIANDKDRDWIFAFTGGGGYARREQDGATINLESLIFDLAPDATEKSSLLLSLAVKEVKIRTENYRSRLTSLQAVLIATETPSMGNMQAWRRSGGTLTINGLIATLDESSLSIAGDLKLDEQHRLEGRLQTEIISPAAFAHALSDAGLMTEDQTDQLAATLTLTSIAGGGKISAPVELKNGAAHLAGMKIADLPAID